jgi:hypothetical protein
MLRIVVALLRTLLLLAVIAGGGIYFFWDQIQRATSDPAVILCEDVVRQLAVAPLTYKRRWADVGPDAASLSFEAKNRMGVPFAELAICKFTYVPVGQYFELTDISLGSGSVPQSTIEIYRSSKDRPRPGKTELQIPKS